MGQPSGHEGGELLLQFEERCRELLQPPGETYLCPITHELFEEPVMAEDGHTYERAAIEQHFATCARSPLTNKNLRSTRLVPNHFCRAAVAQHRADVLRGILGVLPAAGSIQDTSGILALVDRGLEYASSEQEAEELRRHQERLLSARARSADEAGAVEEVIGALEALLPACGPDAARDAVANLEHVGLGELGREMTAAHGTKVLVCRERLVRELDRGWPAVARAVAEKRHLGLAEAFHQAWECVALARTQAEAAEGEEDGSGGSGGIVRPPKRRKRRTNGA